MTMEDAVIQQNNPSSPAGPQEKLVMPQPAFFIGRITKDIIYYDCPLVILIRGQEWRDPESVLWNRVDTSSKSDPAKYAFLADQLQPTNREFIGSIKSSTPAGDSYLCVELQSGDKDKLQSGEWTLLKLFMTRGQEEYFIATTMATVESIAVANANNCQCDFVAMERRRGPVEKSGDEYEDLPGDATLDVEGNGVCDWGCERHGE